MKSTACRTLLRVLILLGRDKLKTGFRRGADLQWRSLPQAEAPTEPAGENAVQTAGLPVICYLLKFQFRAQR